MPASLATIDAAFDLAERYLSAGLTLAESQRFGRLARALGTTADDLLDSLRDDFDAGLAAADDVLADLDVNRPLYAHRLG